jgi:hypothetical protein
LAQAALVSEEIPYYGKEFYDELQAGVTNKSLAMRLKVILKAYHTAHKGELDEINASCVGNCYAHASIGYNAARVFLLGNFYLIKTGNGYGVHDVYCDHDIAPEDFKGGRAAGPNQIPDDRVVNVEHTWPQSRFTNRYPTDLQKADLHHLFPANSKMNSIRGNNPFGEVTRDTQQLACKNVRTGTAAGGNGEEIFEPPREHRGNVARALFYFATRYDLQIDPQQEAFLRKWHKEDPVDQEEMDRNEKIFALQKDRNPFVDYPELVDKIDNF